MKIITIDETHTVAEIEGINLPIALDLGEFANIQGWSGRADQIFALIKEDGENLEWKVTGFCTVQQGPSNIRRKKGY